MRTAKTHNKFNKHHDHGGGATPPSSGMDLMKPHHLSGGQPCAYFPEVAIEAFLESH
jgi:hypothetical protein